jgi:hypothetical protein
MDFGSEVCYLFTSKFISMIPGPGVCVYAGIGCRV